MFSLGDIFKKAVTGAATWAGFFVVAIVYLPCL